MKKFDKVCRDELVFQDVFDFAGKIRTVNLSKGNFRSRTSGTFIENNSCTT